jgi:hypothetical protein
MRKRRNYGALILAAERLRREVAGYAVRALQITGLCGFRQCEFVDTQITLGYTSWFLSATFVVVGWGVAGGA